MALPFLLAGPILRRVEPTSVSVWVAVSEESSVDLQLFHGIESDTSASPLFTAVASPAFLATAPTLRIGKQLHIAVVTVTLPPSDPLPPGALFSYLVIFHRVGGIVDDLKSQSLLRDSSENLALGYAPGALPSFATAPNVLKDLVILHGSCRKPHGSGPDGLAFADSIIKDSRTNATKRPHQMFLTGDQIYADDVAAALLWELIRIGHELLGADEMVKLPDPQGSQHPPLPFSVTAANFPPDRRQALMINVAKFSSEAADSHLISFGEFCAMYLCAWSNAVWPSALRGSDILDPADPVPPPPPTAAYLKPLKGQSDPLAKPRKRKRLFTSHTVSLQEFRQRLPAVRRALANVPVFMMFDDHEITDDWYLTGTWRNDALAGSNPLGRAVIRNGLAAYVLFQGWGNTPDSFATDARYVLNEIAAFFPDGATAGPDENKTAELERDLGFGTTPNVTFDYIVESPVHRVMVLDTRTRRGYDTNDSSPELITGADMTLQFHLTDSPPLVPAPVTLVISPAPAFGLAVMEEWIQPAGAIFMGRLGADMEAWSFDVSAFENLLRALYQLTGPAVVLSGDVHYSFSTWVTYWRGQQPPRAARRFVQLTSSAFKNEVTRFEAIGVGLAGAIGKQVEKVGWFPPPPVIQTVVPSLFPPHFRIRLKQAPVVPTSGWPVLSPVRPHDWAWRLSTARDDRPDFDGTPDSKPEASSSSALPSVLLVSSVVITGAFTLYEAVAVYLTDEVVKAAQRTVAIGSNIGKVQFETQPQGLHVKHSLLSVRPQATDPDKPEAHVFHDILVDPIHQADEQEPVFPR
jgi:hypothetical protein